MKTFLIAIKAEPNEPWALKFENLKFYSCFACLTYEAVSMCFGLKNEDGEKAGENTERVLSQE